MAREPLATAAILSRSQSLRGSLSDRGNPLRSTHPAASRRRLPCDRESPGEVGDGARSLSPVTGPSARFEGYDFQAEEIATAKGG